ALIMTSAAMNSMLERLRLTGRLSGIASLPMSEQPIPWHWDTLTCAFREGAVALSGQLVAGATASSVQIELTCALDERRRVLLTPRGAEALDPLTRGVALESWRAILHEILHARGVQAEDQLLWQRFTVPGTRVAVEAAVEALLLADNELTLIYQVPLSRE